MYYGKEKRAKVDKCNICLKERDLTWDHVPPKFCDNASAKEYVLVLNSEAKFAQSITQNGTRYRSICAECNNDRLGAKYDIVYKRVVDEVSKYMESSLQLPEQFAIGEQINRFTRAIVGHLLAAKNECDSQTRTDARLREYFLEDTLLPPKDMHLYYYLYPFTTSMITRDIVAKGRNQRNAVPHGMLSSLCAFPVAFLLVDGKGKYSCHDLFTFCTGDIDEIKRIPFDMRSMYYPNSDVLRHPYWPANISDEQDGILMVLAGRSARASVFAKKKPMK